jgi:hypothetical protein
VAGRPLHHLPSARSPEFDQDASCVFVIEYDLFRKMAPQAIQDVFRHRHILVLGVPFEEAYFDEDSLAIFGDIDRPRDITGQYFQVAFTRSILLTIFYT